MSGAAIFANTIESMPEFRMGGTAKTAIEMAALISGISGVLYAIELLVRDSGHGQSPGIVPPHSGVHAPDARGANQELAREL
jgi:hypothetical protein